MKKETQTLLILVGIVLCVLVVWPLIVRDWKLLIDWWF